MDCSTVLQRHARVDGPLAFSPIRNGHESDSESPVKVAKVCKRENEEDSCAPLCTTLKDHSNHFIQTEVNMSFSHSHQLLQDQLVDEPLESPHASEHVVRLQVVCSLFTAKLRDKLIPSLVSSGLQFDVFGIQVCELPTKVPNGLSSSIVVAMNDIQRAMAFTALCTTQWGNVQEGQEF